MALELLRHLAPAGLTLAVFYLLRAFLPRARPTVHANVHANDHAQADFGKWEIIHAVACLLATVAATAGAYAFFLSLAVLPARQYKPVVLALTAAGQYWIIPAVLLGFCLGTFSADWVTRLGLRGRFDEYVAYLNYKHDKDGASISKPYPHVLGAVLALLILALSNWYTLFCPEQMVVNRFFQLLDDRQPYTAVSAIVTAPLLTALNGDVVKRREYRVVFADGNDWTTNLSPADLSPEDKRRILAYVSGKSGQPVEEKPLFTKEELY